MHNDYKSKSKKLDAWNEISVVMKCDVGEVKKKMESLLSSFRRERQKQECTAKTGSGTEDIFKSNWFAFKNMLFLMDKFAPKETKNSEVNKNIYSLFVLPTRYYYIATIHFLRIFILPTDTTFIREIFSKFISNGLATRSTFFSYLS